jgi:hypothetical protein
MTTTPKQWELANVGATIVDRTSNIAVDVQQYRDLIHLKPNQHSQLIHNEYIHQIGSEMLHLQPSQIILTKEELLLQKKLQKKTKLSRRQIKVHEMDDGGGQSIMIDLEWDTSTWGDTELQGGVEALIEIFQMNCNYDKKQQAVRMMTKLLQRHEIALTHMRTNIQSIMNRTLTKRLSHGRTVAAALDLLSLLHCSKQYFFQELSQNNFIILFFEMIFLEMKLSVTLIQHAYRSYQEKKIIRQYHHSHHSISDLSQGWGTSREIYLARVQSIQLRTNDLKRKWKLMHFKNHQTKNKKKRGGGDERVLYGVKGPVHMDLTYDQLGLEIVEHLCSPHSRETTSRNREDGILCHAPILLSLFMSATRGSLSFISLRILRHMALSPYSLLSYLPVGVIDSCLRYLHFHTKVQKSSNSTHIIEVFELITRLAHHAAGVERAVADHSYLVNQGTYCDDTHPITVNYKDLLLEYHGKIPDFRRTIGSQEVCHYLSQLILTSTDIAILRSALMAVYVLSCSSCFTNILEIMTQSAGLLLTRIIDFFEYTHTTPHDGTGCRDGESVLGDLALCILLQHCTHDSSREGLLSSDLPSLLRHLYSENIYFHRLSYKRALAVMIALCRVGEWRSYEPLSLLLEIQRPKRLIYLTYMDMMKTIKQPPPDSHSLGYSMNFNELMLLPSDSWMISELSEIAYRVGVKELIDYFTCPLDDKHFSILSWEMASSGCAIISALVSKTKCALTVLSSSVIKYLGNCFYFGFTEIANKELSESESQLYLSGCYAAVESLATLCQSGKSHPDKARAVVNGVLDSNAASAANYFLNTFSNSLNSFLPVKVKELQELVALTSIKFLEKYTSCLLTIRSQETEELMTSVAQTIGLATCRVMKQLHEAFGRTPKALRILDDLCQLLARVTEPSGGTSLALRNWNLIDSLVVHLPLPLTPVGEIYSEEQLYRNGILQLPRSVFDLMASLCKVEQGKALCFSEGFLRRALDKIALTVHHLEGDEELAFRVKQIEKLKESGQSHQLQQVTGSGGESGRQGRGQGEDERDENRLDIASCLRLVALTANFNNPKYGSANEMILHPTFRLIEICARLLNSFTCPRDDSAFLGALKVLRYLARDASRVYDLYKAYHIVTILAREIQNVDTIPADGIIDLVDFSYHIAMGMKGKHIRKELPKMRDPLTKIARIYFRLGEGVSDVLWAISQNHEGAHVDLINEGPIQSDELEALKRQSIAQDLAEKKISMKPGTYEACGVGTCGSLRIPGTCGCHGDFEETNPESEKKKFGLLSQQRKDDPRRLELTKEEADQRLQKEVQKRKQVMGFHEGIPPRRTTREVGEESSQRRKDTSRDSVTMFPPFDATSSSLLSASASHRSVSKTAPAYEPLWKASKTKPKQQRERRSKREPELVSIDLSELPQLVFTKPPKPTLRLSSPS